MLLDRVEEQLKRLEIPLGEHRVLLTMPLVFVLSRDRAIDRKEQTLLERFARDRLLLESGEMRQFRSWMEDPPDRTTTARAMALLFSLHGAPDVTAIDNRTIELVLFECETHLRHRRIGSGEVCRKGEKALERLCRQGGIDLGDAWQEFAPEVFAEPADVRDSSTQRQVRSVSTPRRASPNAARRWRTALRTEPEALERGGLI